jgi:cyclopropane fatty-acyl-phospholipid synthase-like methyltransferase
VTDWESCYQKDDFPWDKGTPSPGLVDFLDQESDLVGKTVCVPGCGMGHDAREWAKHGFDATGVDIAPTAQKMAQERTSKGLRTVSFEVADFLTDSPETRFDWVFEHTLFCAIQPEQRDQYVESVTRWLKPGANYLAVYYLLKEDGGPPFPSTREEILKRFSPSFELIREWVPRSYPNRENLELMIWWQAKEA